MSELQRLTDLANEAEELANKGNDPAPNDDPKDDNPPPQDQDNDDPAPADNDDEPSIEEQAKALGWKDPKEFAGNPDRAKSAEEFIEWSKENHSLTRADNKKLQARLHKLEENQKHHDADIKLQQEVHERALVAQRKDIETEYQGKIDAAIEDGDVSEARKLMKEEAAALEETKAKPKDKEPEVDPAVDDFTKQNDWFGKDRAMTAFAEVESTRIRQEKPDLSIGENLKLVNEAVKKEFAHKFQNTNRNGNSSVDGGKRTLRRKGAKNYDAMPADSRAGCDRAVEIGLVKDRKTFVENYYKSEEKKNA